MSEQEDFYLLLNLSRLCYFDQVKRSSVNAKKLSQKSAHRQSSHETNDDSTKEGYQTTTREKKRKKSSTARKKKTLMSMYFNCFTMSSRSSYPSSNKTTADGRVDSNTKKSSNCAAAAAKDTGDVASGSEEAT